jgi:hypothetical protein
MAARAPMPARPLDDAEDLRLSFAGAASTVAA